MPYKISIIVPVYNAESYLKDAIKSVQKQTLGFDSIQLLLCDDHSSDSSLSICKGAADQHSNVFCLQTEKNSGSASIPRNVCLEHVDAPFIMFLDNDDLLTPSACETLYNKINGSDYDFVAADYLELHYGKKFRNTSPYADTPEREFQFPEDARDFRNIADPFWTKIFRTRIIQQNELRFDPDVYGEDTIFMLKYLVHSKSAAYIKVPVYYYRIRENSLYHRMDLQHFKGVIEGDKIIRKTLIDGGYTSYWNAFITDHVSDFLDVLANSDISDSELEEVIRAWYPEMKEASDTGLEPKTPFAEILFDDLRRGDLNAAVHHMISLHQICRDKNSFVKDLMQSKSWKLISKINQLLRR